MDSSETGRDIVIGKTGKTLERGRAPVALLDDQFENQWK